MPEGLAEDIDKGDEAGPKADPKNRARFLADKVLYVTVFVFVLSPPFFP